MSVTRLRELLDKEHVKYVSIHHSKAFTAQEIAASAHISGDELAKTVMVKLDGKMAMAVLPAPHRSTLHLLSLPGSCQAGQILHNSDTTQ